MEKIIELAKKLKALSDKGVGGEKVNAAHMLEKLLAKHNISHEQIEETERTDHVLMCSKSQIKIMVQIIMMVLGDVKLYRHIKKRYHIIVECTNIEFLEIQAIFDFYWREYENDLKIFTSAFIQKNRLLPKSPGTLDTANLTDKEAEEIRKVMRMMDSIDKKDFLKQLT